MPFDAYRCYLSLKNHFTKEHYDYHKYGGKTRATHQAFYKRKDRFWFEKFARSKNDKEVEEFFVSNFIYSTDPGTMWIGEMIKEGEGRSGGGLFEQMFGGGGKIDATMSATISYTPKGSALRDIQDMCESTVT